MLVGFIVIIIMVLVIVGLMSVGNNADNKTGLYETQIKKIKVFINQIESEAILYHGLKGTFNGFNPNYLQAHNIGKELYTDSDADLYNGDPMDGNHWEGLPSDFNCDGTADVDSNGKGTTDYLGAGRGVFLFKGYEPGNQKAIIINSCTNNNNDYSKLIIVKYRNQTYDPNFDVLFEKEMSNYGTFYGS